MLSTLAIIDAQIVNAYYQFQCEGLYNNHRCYEYSSIETRINYCYQTIEIMLSYCFVLSKKFIESENAFALSISKAIEETSLLDINSYEISNSLNITEPESITTTTYANYNPNQIKTKNIFIQKNKINLTDINVFGSMFSFTNNKQIKLNEKLLCSIHITEEERLKLYKEQIEFYNNILPTKFDNDVISSNEELSNILNLVPFIGSAKNIIEGVAGRTLDGEKLSRKDQAFTLANGTINGLVDSFTFGTVKIYLKMPKANFKSKIKKITTVIRKDFTNNIVKESVLGTLEQTTKNETLINKLDLAVSLYGIIK
ncbi:MAG: hypothetical protein RR435_04195 [Erysipelotrichaceae bacterium]